MPLFKSRSEFDVPAAPPAIVPTTPDNPDLPVGFDDPDNDCWVHPDIRPHYRRDPKGEREAFAGRDALGWARQVVAMSLWDELAAAEKLPRSSGMEGSPPKLAFPADTTPSQRVAFLSNSMWADRLPSQFPDQMSDLFLHARRLEQAAGAATRARQEREHTARYNAEHTCQGCGAVRRHVPARVASARGVPGGVESPLLPDGARLCEDCLPGAVQRWAAAKDAEFIGGRRRGDLLDDWLSRQTARAGAQRPVVQAS